MFDQYKELFKTPIQEQNIKIEILDFFTEEIIENIEGVVTSQNLTLDGSSIIRRSGTLSILLEESNYPYSSLNNILGVNKKVRILISVNDVWFPMGIYVITNLSIDHSKDNLSATLNIQDKMCLLNGEQGGELPASVTFHQKEELDENGEYVITQPTIYQIIQELVHHFGGEPLHKIIITDIENRAKQVMQWRGSSPLFLIKDENNIIPTLDESLLQENDYQTYYYGDSVGYIYTDFVYPTELIADAGESITSVLDKIKDTLGNYEYFYDIYGNFVFQEIKNFLNTTQTKVELNKLNNNSAYISEMGKGKSVFSFDDGIFVESYNNTPQYTMIKNDFIIWGVRDTEEGHTYPIRYHLSLDKKPKVGNTYQVFLYTDDKDGVIKAKIPVKYKNKNIFPKVGTLEKIYQDLSTEKTYIWSPKDNEYKEAYIDMKTIKTKDWRTELYFQGVQSDNLAIESNYYYTELNNEWTKLYNIEEGKFLDETIKYSTDLDYFLDFIDINSSEKVAEISIPAIGRRTKIINDNTINCLFEPEIPDLVLLNTGDSNIKELREECEKQGQKYLQIPDNIYSLLSIGKGYNSAYNLMRDVLYQYLEYNNSITINTIPLYFLEPNMRISVRDDESGILGDYIIESISVSSEISSMMSITANKVLERI